MFCGPVSEAGHTAGALPASPGGSATAAQVADSVLLTVRSSTAAVWDPLRGVDPDDEHVPSSWLCQWWMPRRALLMRVSCSRLFRATPQREHGERPLALKPTSNRWAGHSGDRPPSPPKLRGPAGPCAHTTIRALCARRGRCRLWRLVDPGDIRRRPAPDNEWAIGTEGFHALWVMPRPAAFVFDDDMVGDGASRAARPGDRALRRTVHARACAVNPVRGEAERGLS